jgi:peptidase E
MTIRRIMGTSGGFVGRDRWDLMKPGSTVLRMLELTAKERPRFCFIHTASGDNANYLARSYEAMTDVGCDVTHLQLFTQPNAPVREHILKSDAIWVGGGSVANLLALWKLHEVDTALREAYENGVILGGVSAGSICWHLGGPTDSFGPELQTVTNGLGLLPYGNAVHFDSEAQRRPLAHELIINETFEAIYATDDGVGILYENEVPVEVIRDRNSGETNSAAYILQKIDGAVVETSLNVGLLNRD